MRPTPLRGPAFEAFVARARRRPALWRLGLGTVCAMLIWFATIAASNMLALMFGTGFSGLTGGAGAAAPAALLAYLASFAGLTAGVCSAAGIGHRRPGTLIGPGGFDLRGFRAGALFMFAATGAGALLWIVAGDVPVRQREVGSWLSGLPLALGLVLVQSSAEELLFRGYLTQGLAARFRSPLVWLGAPALLFGALHWSPAIQGENAVLAAAQAALLGLILGDVTARTGNLSPAIGIHFANNVIALLLIADPGPMSGLALFLSSVEPLTPAENRLGLLVWIGIVSAGYCLWLGWNRRGGAR